MHISQVSAIAHSIIASGTEQARANASSPRNLLEQIVNFFTFGWLRHERAEQYDEIAKEMATQLADAMRADPTAWKVQDSLSITLRGHIVRFHVPGEGHGVGSLVRIEISDPVKRIYEKADVPQAQFSRILTLLLMRGRNPDLQIPLCLSAEGNINLCEANLFQADLRGVDLRGADLGFACLEKADLREATLAMANAIGANLDGADLTEADLQGAKLICAHLVGATLTGAKLCGTALNDADLSNAFFCETNFTDADLRHAILSGTDLKEADLTNARMTKPITLFPPVSEDDNDYVAQDALVFCGNSPGT